MPKYKNRGQKKPYNVAQSRVHNVKDKVLTLEANKGPFHKLQKCLNVVNVMMVIMDFYNVSVAIYGTVPNVVEFQKRHWLLLGSLVAYIGTVNHVTWRCQRPSTPVCLHPHIQHMMDNLLLVNKLKYFKAN